MNWVKYSPHDIPSMESICWIFPSWMAKSPLFLSLFFKGVLRNKWGIPGIPNRLAFNTIRHGHPRRLDDDWGVAP